MICNDVIYNSNKIFLFLYIAIITKTDKLEKNTNNYEKI